MATTLRILGWRAKGLRCPDHDFDCCTTEGCPAQVSLVQMPNGAGKTTTLTLLRAALSGAAATWSRTQVQEMRKKGSESDVGTFELRLSLNGKPLTIVIDFSFDLGEARYKTTWRSGQATGFRPPRDLIRFMDEDFVNFYIFDGELAERLLLREFTHAEQAVDSLFQLGVLQQMENRIAEYWTEQTRRVTSKDTIGYKRRINKRDKWRRRLFELRTTKQHLTNTVKTTQSALERLETKYNAAFSKDTRRAEARSTAKEEVGRLQNAVQASVSTLLDTMRDPHALLGRFADGILELKNALDHAKLPESAAREFFEELAQEPECVCGTAIDDTIRARILARAEQYLGTDDVAVLNAMKTEIGDAVGTGRGEAYEKLQSHLCDLEESANALYAAKNVLHDVEQQFEDSDLDVQKLSEEITELRGKCAQGEEMLVHLTTKDEKVDVAKIDGEDESRIVSIPTIEDGIRILEERVEEATETLRLGKKRDILAHVIRDARASARRAITDEICEETNSRLHELMPYNDIRVEKIEGCLVLKGQTGGSVGETLSVGYAFLSTLFDRADQHHLPFIVDSPANPIDLQVRARIGELVPRLSGQFIAFVISAEREKFVSSLLDAVHGDVQFSTLFRKQISNHDSRARECARCHESEDGFLVHDESFFNDFQLDSE